MRFKMADKQMFFAAATSEANLEKLLQDLKTNYSDTQLKQLLVEHGLGEMPLIVPNQSELLKILAHKMLNLCPGQYELESTTSNRPDLLPVNSAMLQDTFHSKQEDAHNSIAGLRKAVLEARESLSSGLSDSNKTHYVVCIPDSTNTIMVHSDIGVVLKLMKEHKNQNPRMLSFTSLADAEDYANKHTANEICQGTTIKSNYPQEKAEVELAEFKMFPSLTTPQFNEFRIYLEKGNITAALERIQANPRYLVQNIDTPTILKEGPRYNALHASVIAGQLESCRLVMAMISDVEYLKRLYETQKRTEENSKRLIDLYLNTPDKVANKTPLHFAIERGYVDIVAFLVSFKVCVRNFSRQIHEMAKKGDEPCEKVLVTGETLEEVACSRYKGPNAASVKAKIINLIREGICYVPLIRSDTTGPYAKVGDPYTPTTPYQLVSEIEDVLRPAPAANLDMDTKDFRNMKVWAFAGPMSPKEAEDFKKEWKSPRSAKFNHLLRENHKIIDGDRGFERYGRELADCHSTSWQEYWPFLDAFADLRSEEGLDKLDHFFQKQQVINLMQALLRKEDFVTTQPYHVSQDYIFLRDLSDSGESEEENEMYFSAESPSCSEEDILDSSDISMLAVESSGDSSTVSPSKPSGGVFSSVWNGLMKLKNILSPGFGKRKHSISCGDNASVMNTESGLPNLSLNSSIDSENFKFLELESDTSGEADSVKSASSTGKRSRQLRENNKLGCKVVDLNTSAPQRSIVQQTDGTYSDRVTGNSSLMLSKVPECVHAEVQSELQSCSGQVHHVSGHTDNLSVTELTREADLDSSHTPDKWKYRTRVQSPESDTSSPEKECLGHLITPCFDLDTSSPVNQAGATVRLNDHLPVHSEEKTSSSQGYSSEAQLDDSFNTKMDTFSRSLQQFTILSPGTPPSGSTTTTPSSPSSSHDTNLEPSVHIFTGKLFSKFLSALKSKKVTDTTKVKSQDPTELPVLFLRQAGDNKTVLGDFFLPGTQGTEDSLSKARGQILDEFTHKEAIKNVWVNFLVIFSTYSEAKRISSLSKDEVICAVIEGMPEDKDFCTISSYNKIEQGGLKELFIKSRDGLYESKHSVTLFVRVVRSSTLSSKDVFVCGTIPTKVDADVYYTLDNKACQLIRKQPGRLSCVSQWYDKMSKQGKDSINSLPSPSRVLRLERREAPPVSPLVGTPLRSNAQLSVTGDVTPSATTAGSKQNDSIVRNLFGDRYNTQQ